MLIKKSTQTVFFTHAQIRNGRIDSNQILRINYLGGRSNIFDIISKSVEGFRRGGGAKMGLSHHASSSRQSLSDRGTGGNPPLRVGEKSFSFGPRQNETHWREGVRLQPLLAPISHKRRSRPPRLKLPTPPAAGSEIPRPKRMYFRIPQQSGQVSPPFLSGL